MADTVPPVLENDRIRLRPLRDTDAERMDDLDRDERTRNFIGRSWAAKFTDGATTVQRMIDRDARGEAFDWAITDHRSDRLIGHVNLGGLTGVDDTAATLGYAVHPDSRGRGVMTDTLKLVVGVGVPAGRGRWAGQAQAEPANGRLQRGLAVRGRTGGLRPSGHRARGLPDRCVGLRGLPDLPPAEPALDAITRLR